MIHTDGHSTIVSRGDCPGCHDEHDDRKVQDLMHRLDTGMLTEGECLQAFSLAQRSRSELQPRHQRLLDALIYAGYLDADGAIVCQMI